MCGHTRMLVWTAAALFALTALYFGVWNSFQRAIPEGPQNHTYRVVIGPPNTPVVPQIFRASQGDNVTLIVTSARPGSIHLHGYERMMPLEPGAENSLSLVAGQTGSFPLHLHDPDGAKHILAAVEVQP